MQSIKLIFIFLLMEVTVSLYGTVRLPNLFSNDMVLQREQPVKIWGWSDKGESVTIKFNGQKSSIKSNSKGFWQITLKPFSFGGPYNLIVKGKANQIVLKNILIGDVWVCAGQSNMGMSVNGVLNARDEIATANYPQIRLLTVSEDISSQIKTDITSGQWKICSPETIGSFSAAGYFFGRNLYRNLNIPIGLINSSTGGTNIETWMSNKSIQKYPEYWEKIKESRLAEFDSKTKNSLKSLSQWRVSMDKDKNFLPEWIIGGKLIGVSSKMTLPQRWEDKLMPGIDGIVWFQKEITLSEEEAKENIVVNLCLVDDIDETYWNGKLIGTADGYNKPRNYKLEKGIAQMGKNIISIKVTDTGGSGGIRGNAEDFYYQVKNTTHSLCGEWYYKPWIVIDSRLEIGPNDYPSLLYNSKINPLTQLPIKGMIWYQGESNIAHAYQYRDLLKSMITDWREKWGQGDFPFMIVQLANCGTAPQNPSESQWAELREAQLMGLDLPKTALAVCFDIGEANDIHARNKQGVGARLAIAAMKVAYDKDIVYSGPVYRSMEIFNNQVLLTFDHAGSGLVSKDKYGYVKGFCIASSDHKFIWAKAFIQGNRVIVYHPDLKNPVAVRYGWADNPDDVNLYNKEGLPASPFRTDNWKMITQTH